MNPISSFFKLMFSPFGKIGRLQYLYGAIGIFILFLTFAFVFGGLPGVYVALKNPSADPAALNALIKVQVDKIQAYVLPAYWLIVFFPNYFFLLMKRLRAIGASAWYALLGLIPLILFFALFFVPNSKGEQNK